MEQRAPDTLRDRGDRRKSEEGGREQRRFGAPDAGEERRRQTPRTERAPRSDQPRLQRRQETAPREQRRDRARDFRPQPDIAEPQERPRRTTRDPRPRPDIAPPRERPRRATRDLPRQAPRARPPRREPRRYDPPPWRKRAAPPRHRDARRHWRPLPVPHRHPLRRRHYRHAYWCGPECRLGFLFGFTVWSVALLVHEDRDEYWPLWDALEYNATGETSLWESDWGYVEFTPTATYRSDYWVRIDGHYVKRWQWCRDFRRIVVRDDGLERHYEGTACRHRFRKIWKVTRSHRVG